MIENTNDNKDYRMSNAICKLTDLETTGSKGLTIDYNGQSTSMFVVKKGEQVFAYLNNCPHAGAPLEWQEDVFLNDERSYIVCGMHGALFEIEDGLCVDGPCFNDSLTSIPVTIIGDEIHLD